jgi:hypothetical protein
MDFNPSHVYQLGYHVEPASRPKLKTAASIEFAAISGFEKDKSCLRRRFICMQECLTKHWQSDATEPIGLFGLPDPSADLQLTSMLDRNVADLLTMFISAVAASEDSVVLIAGRCLTRVVSRLAYRCVTNNALIAFFTWEDPLALGPNIPEYGTGEWSGPFPDFHEDSMVRTFYGRKAPVRVDIFLQNFGSIARSAQIPENILARLQRLDQLSASAGGSSVSPVPPDLIMLATSLCWSDERFRGVLEEHRALLENMIGMVRFREIADRGITAVEPAERLAARLGTKDQAYIRERLFLTLQQKVDTLGLAGGLADFLRIEEKEL